MLQYLLFPSFTYNSYCWVWVRAEEAWQTMEEPEALEAWEESCWWGWGWSWWSWWVCWWGWWEECWRWGWWSLIIYDDDVLHNHDDYEDQIIFVFSRNDIMPLSIFSRTRWLIWLRWMWCYQRFPANSLWRPNSSSLPLKASSSCPRTLCWQVEAIVMKTQQWQEA